MSDAPARTAILTRLRHALDRPGPLFRDEQSDSDILRPHAPVVPDIGPPDTWAEHFKVNLEAVHGTCDIATDETDAVRRATRWLRGDDKGPIEVLAWDRSELPPTFPPDPADITLFAPSDLHDPDQRVRAARLTAGVVSVDAAIASTASMILRPAATRSRAASLLPERLLVLVPRDRIAPSLEAWLHTLRVEGRIGPYFRDAGQVVVVTGPSKSADIELNLTIGVHGPGAVHAIVYDRSPPA